MSSDSFEEEIDYSEDKSTSTSNVSVNDSRVSEEPCFKDILLHEDLNEVSCFTNYISKSYIFKKSTFCIL